MVILLALLAGASEPVGPMPSSTVLVPEGLHQGGVAVVPGAPGGCMAKAQVYVPWSVCKAVGAPRAGDDPLRLEARVTAVPALPGGTRCALVCTPGARLANWSFLLPVVGYRGEVTCPVSRDLTLTLRVDEPHAAPSAGSTVQWQTDLTVTSYVVDDTDLLDGDPDDMLSLVFDGVRRIEGETACPAGQPSRH